MLSMVFQQQYMFKESTDVTLELTSKLNNNSYMPKIGLVAGNIINLDYIQYVNCFSKLFSGKWYFKGWNLFSQNRLKSK